jgi:polyhydroxybutyrate depolymerase
VTLKKYCVIALLAIMAMVLSAGSPIAAADEPSAGLFMGWMEYGGYNRTYEYYIPSSYNSSQAVPLLFSFHGLGSSGTGQIYLTNFTALAEQEGFIAVFPDATALEKEGNSCSGSLPALPANNIQWNVGVPWSLQYCAGVDDVGFISALIDLFKSKYNIDETRIYSTGMSNGAMFAYYVALKLPGTFASIAAVTSPMTTNMLEEEVSNPVTVIVMMGTGDPIVPYQGFGWIGSVDDTINFWIEVNHTSTEPEETIWEPTEEDPTRIVRYVYSGGENGTKVILYRIEGGGHTWPGGPQYALPSLVGLASTHIDGSAEIWENLSPIQFHLTISSTTGGSVTKPGKGTFTYYEGTVVDLVAVAEEGYQFVNWTGDVDTIADVNAAATTITMNDNYSIIANFTKGGCFIATAAYGTPMAEEIQILRKFRDEYLLTNTVGQAFVDFYYKVSPPIAESITEHPSLKPIVRVALMPVVAMSSVAVNTPPTEKMAIIGLLALVSAAVAIWATRRRGKGPEHTGGNR